MISKLRNSGPKGSPSVRIPQLVPHLLHGEWAKPKAQRYKQLRERKDEQSTELLLNSRWSRGWGAQATAPLIATHGCRWGGTRERDEQEPRHG
ncbi:hypothetical protein TIFTF001_021039 [Ficus carica]|uniref:Uncharacterized protein n=1 Tax=Ficus carica TaxID=3494 RepID=A0AA88AS65_FICCA|nr:hypothetical protein TIFTF001_021039 [Ficus carica]